MKIIPNIRGVGGGGDNPNDHPKAGAFVNADPKKPAFSGVGGGDDNPNDHPKAGAAVAAD